MFTEFLELKDVVTTVHPVAKLVCAAFWVFVVVTLALL
jgi:hypothetical protein